MNTSDPPFNLRYALPLWLAQAPEALEQILDAVKQGAELDDHVAGLLDHAYRVRVARLLREHAEAQEFEQLNRHLLRVVHPRREERLNRLDKPYAARWRAFSDLLEDRLSVLATAIPDSVRQRRHVPEILDWIRNRGNVTQGELTAHFPAIGAANLSRILTQLEGWELVVRQRYKKEKIIALGPRAQEVLEGYDPMTDAQTREQTRLVIEKSLANQAGSRKGARDHAIMGRPTGGKDSNPNYMKKIKVELQTASFALLH
ncbi:MAG: hypothetical protein HQL97_04210 [Magnetococcales bacterium]|nr:hypothetical protein [Magnetococcales bacterium]